jgi:hypothetical protein
LRIHATVAPDRYLLASSVMSQSSSPVARGFVLTILGLGALGFAVFGIQWLTDPAAMAQPLGIVLTNGDATSDARAVYGGLEIGLGLFLAYSAWSPARRTQGLAAGALALGGLGLARIAGVLVAPNGVGHATHLLLITDITGITLFVVAFLVSRRSDRYGDK